MARATTSRARARVIQMETIKDVSRRLISEKGVAGLSLREVAREMDLVSSALYRYFANRDELLTALILDAYNDLGAAVERSDSRYATSSPRVRWGAAARTIRRWATQHPHEYALIYGTPVPNYEAPVPTIEAATRVTAVLGKILSDSWARRAPRVGATDVVDDSLRFLETASLSAYLPHVPPSRYVKAVMAWTHIFGFVSFELFGHYVGSVRNTNALFQRVVEELADFLELAA